jgi:hypothetical protein
MGTEIYYNITDRFVVAKCRVKERFVDETLNENKGQGIIGYR